MMLSCKDATDLVSRAQEIELKSWDRFKMKLHLLMCPVCKRFAKQTGAVIPMLKDYIASVELPDEEIALMKQQIEKNQ